MPPHLHRQNAAEQAIQTFKNHFIAGILLTHKYFTLILWCRILPQAIVTLNLLLPSIINPTLSAHAQLRGQFDFNATLFAPPGTKVILHQNPKIRQSWAPRGKIDGTLIDPKTITSVMVYTCQKQERLYSQTQPSFSRTTQRCRLDPQRKTKL